MIPNNKHQLYKYGGPKQIYFILNLIDEFDVQRKDPTEMGTKQTWIVVE